ncbi:TetR/AcrR family transcriptional regulator [Pseudonocardia sp. CA-107938]|uniref:TetR/AcrR family transcriptional regulator n=1 Tax=Pseudonocardia sp. CA-107938 TaxID=3240021 RepID=UPI003D949B1C
MSGLRARKRRETRDALARAARSLALEVGPANVRVGDIADRAGVAPRTYNGYFSSREEAICALHADRADRIAAALRARPADEGLHDALTQALAAEFLGPEPDRVAYRLISGDPMLRGEFLKALGTIEGPLAAAVSERLGTAEDHGLAAAAVAAAAVGAARAALVHWLDQRGDEPFADVAVRALAALRFAPHDDPGAR